LTAADPRWLPSGRQGLRAARGRRGAGPACRRRLAWGLGVRRCRRAPGPSGQPGWLVVSLGMLDAALAVVAGLAVLAARRANRRARVGPATW